MSGTRPNPRPRPAASRGGRPFKPSGGAARGTRPAGGGGGGGNSGGWLLLAFALIALGGFARDPGSASEGLIASPSPIVSPAASPDTGATSVPATPGASATPTPTKSPTVTPTPSSGGDTALDFLETLATAEERRDGYNRDLFRHWTDADGDGCNTRYEVLIAESTSTVTIGAGCALSGGAWFSPYDGVAISDPRTIDIDHMVPLAEAWDSGAFAWSAERREAYANDLGDARALIAVTASSNRSKSDQDPAEWLPTVNGYWCAYASEWVAVKARWGLAVDAAERARLVEILGGCEAVPISVFPA